MAEILPRIYVVSLSDYNAGVLHGRWIRADQPVEDIYAEVEDMLKQSRYPNVIRQRFECSVCTRSFTVTHPTNETPTCTECGQSDNVKPTSEPYPSAEEWAIHDFEGFGGLQIPEYTSVEKIAEVVDAIADYGVDVVAAYVRYHGGLQYTDLDELEDWYVGTYDSIDEYVEEQFADLLDKLEGTERQYYGGRTDYVSMVFCIDTKAFARDLEMSGAIHVESVGGKQIVFNVH